MTININRAFPAYGKRHMRWIENPAAAGLRFVGAAHDINRRNYAYAYGLQHTGWYLDDVGSETVHGVVYQLPARNGRPQYVPGFADPWNDGPACLSFDEIFTGDNPDNRGPDYDRDARDCAARADQIAERMAIDEREFACAQNARDEYERLADDISSARREALALLTEMRAARALDFPDSPTICRAARNRVKSILDEIAAKRGRRSALLAEYDHVDGFRS